MKPIITIVGISLLILGILALSYQGYHYTTHEEIAKLGDLKLTADTQKNVEFPPLLGGLSIAAGVILLLISRIKK